jgi:hypothetical protein
MRPMTVTEAVATRSLRVVTNIHNMSMTNARVIPYAEVYACQSSVGETPIDRIQRAALDEARRKAQAPSIDQ